VSSIFTEMVGRFGTGPIPVYGFTDAVFGAGGFALVGAVVGVVADAEVAGVEVAESELLPVHAVPVSSPHATIAAAVLAARVRIIVDPLPVGVLERVG
jgi:hypothetical protein